ncbi:MAG: L-serine ammonia-lyase, iron-sulfur-dependent, subunit alpha [Clostridiales bacterium]|nr:L-serine ammonia-lyase, iron-sulfur-dependent, subunit alpha [Clostridiales bacterium]
MEKTVYESFIKILEEELVPATGCTEPIAVAYAAALARDTLGALPYETVAEVSGNILKNVKSVVVPNTGGLRGIESAVAAGIVAGNAEKRLDVLADIKANDLEKIRAYIEKAHCTVQKSHSQCVFDIGITVKSGEHSAYVRITKHHTNVVRIERDGAALLSKDEGENEQSAIVRDSLTIKNIIAFANELKTNDIAAVIKRQIACNTAISDEGLKNDYGGRVGKTLLAAFGSGVHNRAKAAAAAGSDARMNGCSLPVVIVSGSGNQGMTASLPVIEYAKELGASEEQLIRALAVADLITVRLKSGIGKLSAYCGAVSAGCGAGAGVCYLCGGDYDAVSHTVINALAINSGILCDGAKSSCAAKIASAVDAGLLGYEMYRNGNMFYGGDGILDSDVEKTIDNVGDIARIGMHETDEQIVNLMIEGCCK